MSHEEQKEEDDNIARLLRCAMLDHQGEYGAQRLPRLISNRIGGSFSGATYGWLAVPNDYQKVQIWPYLI